MTFSEYVAASAVLLFIMVLGAAVLCQKGWTIQGMMAMTGNHEEAPDKSGLAGRADRAASNMIENMVLFGAACIAAVAAGKTDGMATTGAALFFWARLAYWPVYLIGIPYLRTLVWAVSIVGVLQILWPVLF